MKFTPSIAGAISGSLGGLTASRNRGGQYFRKRSMPTNPNSNHQQAVRTAFGGLVQAWANILDATQRQGWKDYALNTPRVDTLGQPLTLTGQQAYIGSNTAKMQAQILGLTDADVPIARVDDAPTVFNTGGAVNALTTFAMNTDDGILSLAWDLSIVPDVDCNFFLFVGRAVSVGTNFSKGPYALANVGSFKAGESTLPVETEITLATASKWAWPTTADPLELIPGQRYPLRMVMCTVDGRYSQAFERIETCGDNTPVGP